MQHDDSERRLKASLEPHASGVGCAVDVFKTEVADAEARDACAPPPAFGPAAVPELPPEFLSADRWTRLVVGGWRRRMAIHSLESRAGVMSLEDAVIEQEIIDSDVVAAGDNFAEVLAHDSGRARDYDLNCSCRRSFALQFGSGNRWKRRHVRTE
jgi:hypothetical protein